jgi:hypothetical protein
MRQDGADNLRFVAKFFREKRPNRPINQARRQGFLFIWPTFTFEKSARNFARRKGFFLVVNGQL